MGRQRIRSDSEPALSQPDRAGSPQGRAAATARPFYIEAAYASCLLPLRFSDLRAWDATLKRLAHSATNVRLEEYERKALWLVEFLQAFREIRSQPFYDVQAAQAFYGYGIPKSERAAVEIDEALRLNLIRLGRPILGPLSERYQLLVNEASDDEVTIREAWNSFHRGGMAGLPKSWKGLYNLARSAGVLPVRKKGKASLYSRASLRGLFS